MKNSLVVIALFLSTAVFSQGRYHDSVNSFLQNYVQTHEVVKGKDREALQFYPADKSYRVIASFKKVLDSKWIKFPTSGNSTQVYKLFGSLLFQLQGKPFRLNVYQSQDLMLNETYRNYLFLPFTDATNGKETYEGGRYIDLTTNDIRDGKLVLDFNKAYNPYCAYVSGKYNCPIPPKENALPVAINAGEKSFGQPH